MVKRLINQKNYLAIWFRCILYFTVLTNPFLSFPIPFLWRTSNFSSRLQIEKKEEFYWHNIPKCTSKKEVSVSRKIIFLFCTSLTSHSVQGKMRWFVSSLQILDTTRRRTGRYQSWFWNFCRVLTGHSRILYSEQFYNLEWDPSDRRKIIFGMKIYDAIRSNTCVNIRRIAFLITALLVFGEYYGKAEMYPSIFWTPDNPV